MLLLKRHLVELVKAGKKRQTIRLWSRPLLRAGQISYTPGLGKMRITAVDELPSLSALTESDAIADGFPNLSALLAEIRRIYGPGAAESKTRRLFRIQFDWPWPPLGKLQTQNAKRKTTTAVVGGQWPVAGAAGRPGAAAAHNQKSKIKNRKSKIETRKSKMSAPQRQSLRRYILACAPKHAMPSSENQKSKIRN